MIKQILDKEKLEVLNDILGEKNKLSILNKYNSSTITDEYKQYFINEKVLNDEGKLDEKVKSKLEILAKPSKMVSLMFTGGASKYEHNICFDQTLDHYITFTATPDTYTLDDEADPMKIVSIMEDFVGRSSLKSVNINGKFSVSEALVIAAMVDMERKSILRAFLDELPYSHNFYQANHIWRILNSTSSNIQWLVYCINEVIGEHVSLTQKQVQEVLEELSKKNVITKQDNQYLLSEDYRLLANRMILVDNIMIVQSFGVEDTDEIVSSGFTSIQSGVHDILLLEYTDKEVRFETINSIYLVDCLKQFIDVKTFYSKSDTLA